MANISVYLDDHTEKRFEKVKEHIGRGVSGTVTQLINMEADAIEEGLTRRQTMKNMQEAMAALRRDVDRILGLLEVKDQ